MIKRVSILGAIAALALSGAAISFAGTATGTTTILGPALEPAPTPVPPPPPDTNYDGNAYENTPTDVLVTISTGAPVVPYEYSLVNKCWFDGKTSGPSDSYERFDLAGPWYEPNPGDPPTTVETVNVQPVPAGAKCKVYVVKNNTAVKGSVTTYDVVDEP